MTWVAVVNSGAGRRSRNLEELRQFALEAGVEVQFHETPTHEQVPGVIKKAIERGITQFVSVGGDGTVHWLVNALMPHRSGTRFLVGVVPSGAGSDLVRTFGHTDSEVQAFARLATPEKYGIDIGQITFADGSRRFFVNVADVGIAAAATRTAMKLPRSMGRTKYMAAFWLALMPWKVPRVEVHVDRHRFEGKAINVAVANGQFFGGGMNIAPRASMSDGKFDVQVFTGKKRQAFSVMPRVLRGSHLTHKAVRRYLGSTICVDGPSDLELEADGELLGSGPIRIDMIPDAIDLVI